MEKLITITAIKNKLRNNILLYDAEEVGEIEAEKYAFTNEIIKKIMNDL